MYPFLIGNSSNYRNKRRIWPDFNIKTVRKRRKTSEDPRSNTFPDLQIHEVPNQARGEAFKAVESQPGRKMSSVKECEKLRGAAEIKLNGEIRKLRKACEKDAPNPRTVSNILKSLDAAHNALIDAHVAYVLQLKSELGEARHVQFIERIEDAVEDIKNTAFVIIGEIDDDGNPIEEGIDNVGLAEEYDLTLLRITAQMAELRAVTAADMTKDQHGVFMKQAIDLNDMLLVKFRGICTGIRKAFPDDVVELSARHENVFKEKIPQIEKVLSDLRAKKLEAVGVVPPPGAHVVDPDHGAGHGPPPPRKQTIKLKPLEAPIFDGKAKTYTRFKQRFEEMITGSYDPMGQLEFLEKAIPSKIKDRMSMVQKSPEQIWEQLDEMFADPKVMIRETMDEIHSLDE